MTGIQCTSPAERRAFIRDHHPDRGGDPEQFVKGLARFDPPASGTGKVTVYRTRRYNPARWWKRRNRGRTLQ